MGKNETTGKLENGQKVAVVTGSSSGIGYATVLALARSGYLTFATMRNTAKGADLVRAAEEGEKLPIRVEQLDITDPDSIQDFTAKIRQSAGRIDVLVNNAGYFSVGPLEDLTMKEIQDQLDTNLLGTIRVTQQVLPLMRVQKRGIIVNVSSVVGRFGLPGISAYVATKFALEGLSESLAHEVEPFGIKVILVEPGVVKTKVFDNRVVGKNAMREGSPYSGMLGSMNTTFGAMLEHASSSEQVASVILQAISSSEPKMRYLVGQDAAAWIEKKDAMSDEQFQKYLKDAIAGVAPSQR